ncbi:hypothetical protein SCLCIDRAFT_1217458 [Scleroderma citrinum Foug A]|uniref:Uncharacterized protein n=1 Tax=Scleroderma citrinum Foug A TaxID=1036808 RepID=A0A0C3DUG7_9AGAM|nr:hypothetical protein SCLCIDRAFT_1217458 [Scleroderma citrinum Foug A]
MLTTYFAASVGSFYLEDMPPSPNSMTRYSSVSANDAGHSTHPSARRNTSDVLPDSIEPCAKSRCHSSEHPPYGQGPEA